GEPVEDLRIRFGERDVERLRVGGADAGNAAQASVLLVYRQGREVGRLARLLQRVAERSEALDQQERLESGAVDRWVSEARQLERKIARRDVPCRRRLIAAGPL